MADSGAFSSVPKPPAGGNFLVPIPTKSSAIVPGGAKHFSCLKGASLILSLPHSAFWGDSLEDCSALAVKSPQGWRGSHVLFLKPGTSSQISSRSLMGTGETCTSQFSYLEQLSGNLLSSRSFLPSGHPNPALPWSLLGTSVLPPLQVVPFFSKLTF